MNAHVKVPLAGYFKLVATKLDGSQRVLADWFPNLILDQGLNRMGTGIFMSCCQVGSGSTAPSNTNTALEAYVAGTNTIHASVDGTAASAPYYGYKRRTYRFGLGVAEGNLSEVGVGWTTTTGNLYSRSLIKDGGGSPTTITVLADEYLDVIYELRAYAPASDTNFDVVISGTTYTFTCRASRVTNSTYWAPRDLAVGYIDTGGTKSDENAYNGSIGAVTSTPSGTADAPTTLSNNAYSNTSLRQDMTVVFSLDEGNLAGGISALLMSTTIGSFQLGVSPVFDKTNVKILTLVYRVSWARHV